MKKTSDYQAGFTLVEVMVAMSILLIGLLGLWKLSASTYGVSNNTFNRYLAFRQCFNESTHATANTTRPMPGHLCYDCNLNGICEQIDCSNATSSSWLPLRVDWSEQEKTFRFHTSVAQAGNTTNFTRYRLVTTMAGWGGNATDCLSDIDNCSNTITIFSVRLPKI